MQACTFAGVATSVGAVGGIAAAREGGLKQSAIDTRIAFEINDLWFRHDVDMFRKLDMTINNGRVLLTGVVQNPEHRVEAVRLAWHPEGVEQVINEITVADSDGITGFARDAWITGRLRTALMFNKNVLSVNYNIDTVKRVVYLMGWAQSQAELDRVISIAQNIADIEQVVSYVKLVGERDEPVARSTITSQQYARPPQELQDNRTREQVNWDLQNSPAQIQPAYGEEEPVVIVPEQDSYSVRASSGDGSGFDGSTTDVIQSEDLLWDERQY